MIYKTIILKVNLTKAHGPHHSPEEDFYIFSISFYILSFYKLAINSPCRRAWFFIFKKNWFSYPRMLYARFGWNWHWSTEVEKNSNKIYFYYFAVISPWGRMWAFICIYLNFIYPRMLCTKFGWNWPSSFKERIFKYFQYNLTISLLSWIFSTQGCFVSSWLKLT